MPSEASRKMAKDFAAEDGWEHERGCDARLYDQGKPLGSCGCYHKRSVERLAALLDQRAEAERERIKKVLIGAWDDATYGDALDLPQKAEVYRDLIRRIEEGQ